MTWRLGPLDDVLLGTRDHHDVADWLAGVDARTEAQLGGASLAALRAASGDQSATVAAVKTLYRTAFGDRDVRLAAAAIVSDIIHQRRPPRDCTAELATLRGEAPWIPVVFELYNPPPPHAMDGEMTLIFSALELWKRLVVSPGIEEAIARRRLRDG